MDATEETINATLDRNGQIHLSHPPQLPPGPVRVTIRPATATGSQHGLADLAREIAAEQRARGFPGRSAAEIAAETHDALPKDDWQRHVDLLERQLGDPAELERWLDSTVQKRPRREPPQSS